jgi:hypothetical protein
MTASIKDMRIDHDRTDVPMPEEFLDRPNIIAVLKQMGSKRMPEGVAARWFVNPYIERCLLYRVLRN